MVALSEMGDKTQLLAFSLAVRLKNARIVMTGILIATLANHLLASWIGQSVSLQFPKQWVELGLGLLFVLFALWTLKPDEEENLPEESRFGPLLTTILLFFLAEMGDKTQFATAALGARFQSVIPVTLGTTAGMMLADGLAVLLGDKLRTRIPMHRVRQLAAVSFLIFGVLTFFKALRNFAY